MPLSSRTQPVTTESILNPNKTLRTVAHDANQNTHQNAQLHKMVVNVNSRGITMDVVEKSTGQVRRRRGETMESCCLRVTHLRLQSKKLTHGLEIIARACPGLKVLYAYDNFFREAHVSHKVEHLFLQDNLLSSLQFVANAHNLKYLNVANNCIPELNWIPKAGNDEPLRIEKINISRQRPIIKSGADFGQNNTNIISEANNKSPNSDGNAKSPSPKSKASVSPQCENKNSPRSTPRSLPSDEKGNGGDASSKDMNRVDPEGDGPTLILRTDFLPRLSHCLQEICIAENRLRDINALQLLPNLTVVNAERNLISRLDQFSEFLSACPELNSLKMSGNPYCQGNLHSWRDPIIVQAPNLTILNEKEVSENEKIFVRELAMRSAKKAHERSRYNAKG